MAEEAKPASRFVGKVAIVTGSNSGLGLAVALRLVQGGACVTLTGRDKVRLDEAAAQCVAVMRTDGGEERTAVDKVLAIQGDITSAEVREELVDKTVSTFGRLDILVNNAGVFSLTGGLDTATEENFDLTMAVNVKAALFMTQLAAPHLEKTRGNVIFVSSTLSEINFPQTAVYSASKAAVDSLTRNIALTLAPRGVRVNSVNPSYMPTRLIRDPSKTSEELGEMAQSSAALFGPKHPLHGRCATLREYTDVVLFLASEEAAFVTGERLSTDGGVGLVGAFSG